MQKFGNEHTEHKLIAVESYLKSYTTALSKQNFELVYFDAFAGTGSIDISTEADNILSQEVFNLLENEPIAADVREARQFIDGSAKRALALDRKFDRYYFVESSKAKVKALANVADGYPGLRNRIHIRRGDANECLAEFCRSTDWLKTRAVVFLDPFGSQVDFETLKVLATTRAVDVWYLFPTFWSVFRQISNAGKMTPEQERSITRVLGTDEWKREWIRKEVHSNLFDDQEVVGVKQVELDDITKFMIKQMKTVFDGRVLDQWLPLGNNGTHQYSLLFAWANPSERARLAAKLASHVMGRK